MSAFKFLTGKPSGNRLLGRPRRRREDDIRVTLKAICVNTKNWDGSAQDRDCCRALLNAVLKIRIP